jgi:hypothetical protein
MNQHDSLELELAALRPHAPSPELMKRIAERLGAAPSAEPRQRTSKAWRRGAIVSTLLAASLAAIVLWRGDARTSDADVPAVTIELDLRTALDESSPSLWSYRRAVLQSSGSLDDVLNRFDVRTFEPKAGGAPDLLAARYHSDNDSFWREL